MAINKNHEFEELNGVKCGIVEKNASAERVEFLKKILEFNKYEVVVVPSPAPKAAPAPKPAVQSAAGSQQSAVSSQQPAVSSQQPAAGSQQPAVSSQQSAVGSQQSAVSSQQPAVSSQQPAADQSQPQSEPQPEPTPPATFTIGVTDYTFNPINAIFGRMLKTPDGHFVTLAYWHQKEKESHDEIPYYEQKL
jgi:hypothetical protein